MKICSLCKELKAPEEFGKRKALRDGLMSHCRVCDRENSKKWYKKNRGKRCKDPSTLSPSVRHFIKNAPVRLPEEVTPQIYRKLYDMLHAARKRAKARNREFDIDIQYLLSLYVDKCPIFGVPINWNNKGTGTAADNSPSLDRIDSSLGYVKGNLWIISWRANMIKSNASPQELITVANALLSR